jgi:hypothetical protein
MADSTSITTNVVTGSTTTGNIITGQTISSSVNDGTEVVTNVLNVANLTSSVTTGQTVTSNVSESSTVTTNVIHGAGSGVSTASLGTSTPVSGVEGQLFVDTDTNVLYVYINGSWVEISGGW